MDHPVRDVPGVITALCQGTAEEQRAALEEYFLPEAYFVHPFCRVPSFGPKHFPVIGTVTSRWFVCMIYRWYRILSPHIELKIESTVFDQRNSLLYLTIRQVFQIIWLRPFYTPQPVRLVTVLKLASRPVDDDNHLITTTNGIVHEDTAMPGHTRFFIAGQEDLYQVDQFLRFISLGIGAWIWYGWQLFATFLSVIGAMALLPVQNAIFDLDTKSSKKGIKTKA